MLINFEKFYRNFGIRQYSGLTSTRVYPVRVLPLNSMVHCLTDDGTDFPDVSSIFVKTSTRKILLQNYTELLPENHSTGKRIAQVRNLITEFVMKNHNFVNYIRPLSDAREPQQLVFANYNLVDNLYRYNATTKTSPYWKWFDRQKLMWHSVEEAAQISQRNHFYDFVVPDVLPSKAKLDMYTTTMNMDIMRYFPDSQSRFILDLWKWFNPVTREHSALGQVSVKNLKYCNILFRIKDGRSAVLNLGYLNSWIDGQPNQTDRPKVAAMPAVQLRMFFLRFLMNLQSYNLDAEKAEREFQDAQEDDRLSEEPSPERDLSIVDREDPLQLDNREDAEEAIDQPPVPGAVVDAAPKTPFGSEKLPKIQEFKESAASPEPLTIEAQLKEIEEESKILEQVEERRARKIVLEEDETTKPEVQEYDLDTPTPVEEIHRKVFEYKRPEDRLMATVDEQVSKGNMAAVDYRKILKTLEGQNHLKDPFGSGRSLTEMTTITEKDVTFDKAKTELVGDDRVLDKTMLSSCVESLDRDYIKNTMTKDVVSSIMSVQGAGVIVTDVQHETQHSVLGAFDSFSVSLKPIDGRSSVIRFKMPKVDEDGTFKANGVRYHMRKQRVDLPIRKTAPDRVALSSYYGKLFVYRSPKIARSGLATIVDHLTKASIGEVPNLTVVRPTNVYDNNFVAPFIYNSLATVYKSFNVKHPVFGEFILDFQHTARTKMFDEKVISSLEKNGSRVVGKTIKDRPIYVTMDNEFFVKTDNGDQPLGDIFDILEIDRLDTPVDPAEVKILGNSLPVGLILARAMGLKNLIKFVGARNRIVKGRQKKDLQPYEYVLSFADYSIILDRRDVKASLILGGLTNISKLTKAYPAEAFEKKDVYDDIIDSTGGNIVQIRELDLLASSYVDEITKSLLETMKEPTTFFGLLVRSCEMLEDYNHPDTQDLGVQQIRGYERFAGMAYKQMIRSIRDFRNKNISGKSKVEMSPYAVWQTLMEDRAVKTCEDINPIQNLKMHEAVTFAGDGGRSKDTFLKDSRAFSPNDAGVVSEASVDSSDVGYNIFLSSNPQIENVRGVRTKNEIGSDPASYLSPSLLLAVGAQHDDRFGLLQAEV